MDKWKRVAPEHVPPKTRFQETPKYEQGLYDLGQGIYAWMVPNGSWGENNTGLIVGKDASLLIDTQWDIRYTQAMLDAMRPWTDASPLTTVVNTHADGDHWWGNQLVPNAEIITSQACYNEMTHIKPASMILLGKRLGPLLSFFGIRKVGHWFQNMVAPYHFEEVMPVLPSRRFENSLSLEAAGHEIHLIEMGPAHTQGDFVVYLPKEKVLFAADILFIGSTPVMWAGPVENWLAALDKILDMKVDVIVPGHGPITDQNGVKAVKNYWTFVQDEVRKRFDAGMSAEKAATDIALGKDFAGQPFAGWNSPERLMTNTHTIYRQLQGRTDAPKVPELISIMWKQALLAHQLPNAQPAVMRLR
ncbi:MAG: MBL fold metallo-hydrolase [Anaerolineae bacterium]|nr:MBL fold metallo-hydrolase [Anaerolineae bacterium]